MFTDNFFGDLAISDKMSGLVWIISSVQNYDEYEVLLRTYVDNRRYLLGCLGNLVWGYLDMFETCFGACFGLVRRVKEHKGIYYINSMKDFNYKDFDV